MSGYQAAEDYILSFSDYERAPRQVIIFDLKRINELERRLGDPHRCARAVHIAGTKGKGSTAAMVSSVLTAAGYRTGFFSSPHLLTMRERIRLDGRPIPEDRLVETLESLKPHIDAMDSSGEWGAVTTFEVLTALAFIYFRQEKVGFQVLEVGLGGRLDCTNVVQPEVSIITAVNFDHTHILGNTIRQIAGEKAGIIKPNSIVVSSPQLPEAEEVIAEKCRREGARLVTVGRDICWKRTSFDLTGQRFELLGHDLFIPLLGSYQLDNATAAVAALLALAERGAKISWQHIAAGLATVDWPGRFQVLGRRPLLVVDGAHNPYGMHKLCEALREYVQFDKAILVLGATGDKDIPGILAEAAALTGRVIVTRAHHPKSAPAPLLAAELARLGVAAAVAPDVPAAIDMALAQAGPHDLVCVTGSLFIVAEALQAAQGGRLKSGSVSA